MHITTTRLGLPTDGPHTPDTVLDAARALSDLADYLARATTDPDTTAKALDDLLINLADVARGLDQTLQQISTSALRLRVEPGLRDDRGEDVDPADTAETVADATAEARVRLARVATALHDAASAASHLGRDADPEPTAEDVTCRRCRRDPVEQPGQPAPHGEFCSECINRCHDASDFAHTCQVCQAPPVVR